MEHIHTIFNFVLLGMFIYGAYRLQESYKKMSVKFADDQKKANDEIQAVKTILEMNARELVNNQAKLERRLAEINAREDVIIHREVEIESIARDLMKNQQEVEKKTNELLLKEFNVSAKESEVMYALDQNKTLLKRNSVELYHVKECSMWLYDHYKRLLDTIDKAISQDDMDESTVWTIRMDAVNSLGTVERYFMNTFNIHPMDYKKQKTNIVGVGKSGNRFSSDASIN